MNSNQLPSHRAPAGQDDERIEVTLRAAVLAVIGEQAVEAARLLSQMQPLNRLQAGGRPLGAKERLRLFRRDRFTCRYCGRRTIFVPVLRVLSAICPQQFPYHPHWRWEATHPVYWTHGTSCDHVVPVSRGGQSHVANLVTTCYQCNTIKQHWLLDELRWSLLHPEQADQDWDGLSGLYLDLCKAAGVGPTRYHSAWISALAAQGSSPASNS